MLTKDCSIEPIRSAAVASRGSCPTSGSREAMTDWPTTLRSALARTGTQGMSYGRSPGESPAVLSERAMKPPKFEDIACRAVSLTTC